MSLFLYFAIGLVAILLNVILLRRLPDPLHDEDQR